MTANAIHMRKRHFMATDRHISYLHIRKKAMDARYINSWYSFDSYRPTLYIAAGKTVSMPGKLSQFWNELKRRNVVRVVTVYAGAAFVILELADIIAEPLKLPAWLLPVVIVLLSIGLIIAIILSWIYDIHPEEGMVKTEPAKEGREEDKAVVSKGWKIASYISFGIIAGLIILNLLPRTGKQEILDKSIAVLPFINDSPDQEKMYFINGIMEEILNHLCKIQDLKVVSRNSVEQYRNNPKSTPEIAEEMNVSYVLEGSGQREGNRIRLTVQLLDARNDRHLWSESYLREIEDIFSLQSEIAQSVASEIKSVITPEEAKLIEITPTTSLTAYDFYQRGREENWTYMYDRDPGRLDHAEAYFYEALSHDSTYAGAYAGLANVYWNKKYTETYLSEAFLDSVLMLANRALFYDPYLSEAHIILGRYYTELGESEKAVKEFDQALQSNPNNWEANAFKAQLFSNVDLRVAIECGQKALQGNKGPELPGLLRGFSGLYANAGFKELAFHQIQEALSLDHDSAAFYRATAGIESSYGNYRNAVDLYERAYALDTTNASVKGSLGYNYMFLGKYEESIYYYEKWLNTVNLGDRQQYASMHRIGYAYYGSGQTERANFYMAQQLQYCMAILNLFRIQSSQLWIYYDLAGVYAFQGKREKAYENLRIFNQRDMIPLWMFVLIKDDPLFDSIRSEPEFQQILKEVENKYQSEHDRVKKWLEENDRNPYR